MGCSSGMLGSQLTWDQVMPQEHAKTGALVCDAMLHTTDNDTQRKQHKTDQFTHSAVEVCIDPLRRPSFGATMPCKCLSNKSMYMLV